MICEQYRRIGYCISKSDSRVSLDFWKRNRLSTVSELVWWHLDSNGVKGVEECAEFKINSANMSPFSSIHLSLYLSLSSSHPPSLHSSETGSTSETHHPLFIFVKVLKGTIWCFIFILCFALLMFKKKGKKILTKFRWLDWGNKCIPLGCLHTRIKWDEVKGSWVVHCLLFHFQSFPAQGY